MFTEQQEREEIEVEKEDEPEVDHVIFTCSVM